jgi:hypothetical protein
MSLFVETAVAQQTRVRTVRFVWLDLPNRTMPPAQRATRRSRVKPA